MEDRKNTDVTVVGGGLAGLAAAAYMARGGQSVVLYEKASQLGGRAATTVMEPFHFNLGPHALYAGGHGIAILREMGVPFNGTKPSASGAFAYARGAKHALPGGFLSLVTTGLFGLPAKLETARLLAGFGRIDTTPLSRVTMREWIDSNVRHAEVRQLVEALVRVATYSNDPERMSAGAAITQVQGALGGGVLYLDGGWQTLVDGLIAAATAAGVRIATSARADAIEPAAHGWQVRLADGSAMHSRAVVIAGGPDVRSRCCAARITRPRRSGRTPPSRCARHASISPCRACRRRARPSRSASTGRSIFRSIRPTPSSVRRAVR
jgi:phytoene dehydrogenase-like protein